MYCRQRNSAYHTDATLVLENDLKQQKTVAHKIRTVYPQFRAHYSTVTHYLKIRKKNNKKFKQTDLVLFHFLDEHLLPKYTP